MVEQTIPWQELIAILHRRRKLILQVLIAGVVTVAVGVWLKPPGYTAKATVMVTSERATVAVSPDAETGVTVTRVTVEDLNSEVALLKSEALVRQVLEKHRNRLQGDDGLMERIKQVVKYPLTLPGQFYRYIHGVEPATALDYWVEKTAEHVTVNPIVESNLIQVSFDADSPEWAATFVNELIATHIARQTQRGQQNDTERFYEDQRQILGERSKQADVALQSFYAREGIESMPERRAALQDRLAELETALENAETDLAAGTARIAFASKAITQLPRHIATEYRDQSVQLVKPRILELELQRSQALSKYAPTSVVVQDIDRQITEAKRLYESEKAAYSEATSALNPAYQTLEVDLTQTRALAAAEQARVDKLSGQVSDYRTKLAHLEEIESERQRLEQEVGSAREVFVTYSKKQEEARFSNALDASRIVNLAVAEPADPPATPTQSSKRVVVGLGAVLSLMAGIAAAFVRDRLDPAVKSAAEARNVTGLRVLAEVR